MSPASLQGYGEIQAAIVALLETARRAVARSINAAMTATYWEIGRRIVEFEQGGAERAAYGDALVERLAKDLTQRFGRGFSRQNLWQMRAFYRAWPAQVICRALSSKASLLEILQTPSRESTVGTADRRLPRETDGLSALAEAFPLPWSAYVRLLPVRNELARQFYETGQMHLYLNYARQHWSKPGENPPVGLIICAAKGVAEAHYALEGLPNRVLAAEYRTVLPDEKLLAEELVRTRRQVGVRPPQEMPHGHDPLLLPNGFSSIKLQSVSSGVAHFGQPGYETDLLYVAGLLALVLGGSGPFSLAKRANTSR